MNSFFSDDYFHLVSNTLDLSLVTSSHSDCKGFIRYPFAFLHTLFASFFKLQINNMKKHLLPFVWLLFFLVVQQHGFAQGEIQGVRLKGSRGITETVAKIMARQATLKKKRLTVEESEDAEPIYPDRRHLPQNPFSPATPGSNPNASRSTSQTLSPQTPGTSFTGAGRSMDGISSIPPDNMGAIGPSQYILIINGRIRSFNKTTGAADGALNSSDATFWTSVRNNTGVSDPRIRYDRKTQRWFAVEINVANTLNRIMIAVSSGPTISASTSFTFYQFSCPSGFDDYPTLGIDDNALYIGTNNFTSSIGNFSKTNGYVINKANLIAGTLTVTSFQGLGTTSVTGPYTPQGVDNFDNAPTYGYFVGTDLFFYGKLQIRRVSNAGSASPTISGNITVNTPTTVAPLGGVPFQGATSGRTLDDLDERLFAAVIRNNRLWTAHNIQVNASGVASSTGGRDGSRWYEIDVSPATPALLQSGTIFDPSGANPVHYFIPSVMVSGQGHAAFGLSSAGATAFINTATTGRLNTDASGTTGSVLSTTTSSTSYNLEGTNAIQRWGDYSFVSLDPIDDMTMWMVNEYCDATNSWGSRVTKLVAPPPAEPISCNPSSVASGLSSVNVVVAGISISGSGFYDPGTNISGALPFNHISTVVSGGGVVVNSITYTDATHITLNLNTTGASAGNRTISITNPDGQTTSSSSGILNIVLGAAPTSNSPVCPGNTLNLFANPSGGISSYTFSWTGPNSFSSTAQNPTITNVSHANAGTYTVIVTDNAATPATATASMDVTVDTTVVIDSVTAADTFFCAGNTTTLTVHSTSIANPVIQWLDASHTPAGTGATLPNVAAGKYYVGIQGNCNIAIDSIMVWGDTVKPVITTPAVLRDTAIAGACSVGGIILPQPVSYDNCGIASITNDHLSDVYTIGINKVLWTVTDNSGNWDTVAQYVVVYPAAFPVLRGDANNGACTTTINLTTPAGANCGDLTITNNHPSSTFSSGTTYVTWTFTNNATGRSLSVLQAVVVYDKQAPVFPTLPIIRLNADAGQCSATTQLTVPQVTDNCMVDKIVNDYSAPTFPVGTTYVKWTATDKAGNKKTAQQAVVVYDNQAPVFPTMPIVRQDADNGACYATVTLTAPAVTDNCGTPTVVNDHSSSQFAVGTVYVKWTATDVNGNKKSVLQPVVVYDKQAPVWGNVPVVRRNADPTTCNATIVLDTPQVSDNCGIKKVTNDHPSTTYSTGWTYVTWTAEDVNGNIKRVVQPVVVYPAKGCPTSAPIARQIPQLDEQDASTSVYPNPTKGKFEIALENLRSSKGKVSIIAPNGKTIYKQAVELSLGKQTLNFNISSHAPGVYLVKIVSSEEVQMFKVMLE